MKLIKRLILHIKMIKLMREGKKLLKEVEKDPHSLESLKKMIKQQEKNDDLLEEINNLK